MLTALALASLLAAEHHYIVPIVGTVSTVGTTFHIANAELLNATARTATVRRTGVFPDACASSVAEQWTVAPRTAVVLGTLFNQPRCLAAVSVVSDEPLAVTGTITSVVTLFGENPLYLRDVQIYEAPTAWIEAGTDALTQATILDRTHVLRANLLLVNPNDDSLTVEARVVRPEVGGSRTDVFRVAPRSIALFRIGEVEDPSPSPFPRVVSGHHDITLRGSHRFQAGTSSLDPYGGNVFRKATPLEP